MSSAIARQIPMQGSLFLDGQWTAPAGKDNFTIVNPTTEDVLFKVPVADTSDVERAVQSARQAFAYGPWPRMSPNERASYLSAIARLIAERADAFADVWSAQIGVTRGLSGMMSSAIPGFFDMYAAMADSGFFEEEHRGTGAGHHSLLVREPVGVVAAIVPWNAPLMLTTLKIAPALLAGCCIILKPSPEAPGEAHMLAEIGREVGLPAGVLNVLVADRDVSEALVRHPLVDKVSFTGSLTAGRKVASICGDRIARCTLELGGKSAAIFLDDYDVEAAARAVAGAAPMISGQVCAALTRIIVTRAQKGKVVEALSTALAAVRVGDPFSDQVDMGPVAGQRQQERVRNFMDRGLAEGATLITGGGRPAGLDRGFFIAPTLFSDVEPDCILAKEEIFGPVLSVIEARDQDHAVEIANASDFGLNAAVFTQDTDRAYAVARRLQSGTVGHNGFRNDFAVAFGGFKKSGIGREGGLEGLRAYTEIKTIVLDGERSASALVH
ncbi:MAG: aldehyde dehydrogenase [Novosphingobium sp.]